MNPGLRRLRARVTPDTIQRREPSGAEEGVHAGQQHLPRAGALILGYELR